MVQLEQRLVDETVAVPFVFFIFNFREIDGFLYQRAEYVGLRQGLSVHLSYPCTGAVGGNHRQRNLLVEGFRYGRVQVEQGGAGGAAYGHRSVPVQGETQREESGTPFVCHRIAGETGYGSECLHNGDVPAPGTKDGFPYAVCFQESRELEYVLFVRVHD